MSHALTGPEIAQQHTDGLRALFSTAGLGPIVAPNGEEYYEAAAVVAALRLEQTEARELAAIAAYVPDPQEVDEPVNFEAWRDEVRGWRDQLAAMTLVLEIAPGRHVPCVPLWEVCINLLVYSEVPEAREYMRWLVREFMPAISQHGYYEPTRNHEPPAGGELDALERREGARDALNALVPGLGDLARERRKE